MFWKLIPMNIFAYPSFLDCAGTQFACTNSLRLNTMAYKEDKSKGVCKLREIFVTCNNTRNDGKSNSLERPIIDNYVKRLFRSYNSHNEA